MDTLKRTAIVFVELTIVLLPSLTACTGMPGVGRGTMPTPEAASLTMSPLPVEIPIPVGGYRRGARPSERAEVTQLGLTVTLWPGILDGGPRPRSEAAPTPVPQPRWCVELEGADQGGELPPTP